MAKIGIFLGSSTPSEKYSQAVKKLGRHIAQQGHSVICGANGSGLMEDLIGSILSNDGEILGILPADDCSDEIPHEDLTKILSAISISERKKIIRDQSDVILVCPGGLGTLDEFFETLALKRLGKYCKPIGLLNIDSFYDPILIQIENLISEGFAKVKHNDFFITDSDPIKLVYLLLSEMHLTEAK
jgi:uncharacterized protein (TIGR00730 family)